MAEPEFEEFSRQALNIKAAPTPYYSIVTDIDLDVASTPSPSKSDSSEPDEIGVHIISTSRLPQACTNVTITNISSNSSVAEDDELGDGLRTGPSSIVSQNQIQIDVDMANQQSKNQPQQSSPLARTNSLSWIPGQVERRRRKLPEIPKNKKSTLAHLFLNQTSLADELGSQTSLHSNTHQSQPFKQNSLLAFKCSYLLDEDSSPDSDRMHSFADVDSGHSTAHSPNDYKSITPPNARHSPFPPPFGGVPYSQLEMLEATHRGLHKFLPRHHDELEIEIGDPIYVQKEADDLWCEGVNLRTGNQGVFPSAYAVDLEYNDFDPTNVEMKRERYLLGYLGSVETLSHKGTGVVCQAVRKIVGDGGDMTPKGQACILEISDQGLRMVDRSKKKRERGPCIDYFYSLKNVSFCAFHPRDHRYIGFITKHPTMQRFACHVFIGTESTRVVAEAVGRAFQRFYQKFIETAYPIEDIYMEN
ncbi:hypothetical protein PVAND_006794 [Polypedilum vanderplanki]|uniref:JNK-interacting protein 1 n=1 Tax=Polypedilum vanderplanki TaxID=319348 RepID=A0A9J6C4A6_POLVA|nr:hypothetical protein PVAND_006794 [Polypedilum vanderplanki]